MNKALTIGLALLTALAIGLITGCDQDSPNGPMPRNSGGIASIEMRVTHNLIRGFSGDLRTEQITAIARDAQGVALPGVEIEFAIRSPEQWKGTLSAINGDSITDENGQIRANYSVVIDRTAAVEIEARAGQVLSFVIIQLTVVDDIIGSLSMEAMRRVLASPPDRTQQTTVTATLVDKEGNALPGMQLRFRTSPPSLGYIDSDTATTDFSGRATRTFTSIVNKYGLCEVTANIGDYEGKTTIEIRPVAAPAHVNLSTSTPVVVVVAGESAEINLEAVITDENRVGVPGASVAYEVLPFAEGQETFGALSAADTTDAEGKARARFNSLGSFGSVVVRVSVLPSNLASGSNDNPAGEIENTSKGSIRKTSGNGDSEISDEIVLQVKPLKDEIGSLTIRALPQFLNLPPDSNGVSNIQAQVRDLNFVGISNVRVEFVTNMGTLSNPTVTDQAGVATVVFRNNFEAGVALVTASIPGTIHSATAEITVQQSAGETGTLSLTADRDFIYADDGLTTASLTALLSDEDGQALTGREIIFTKTHGTVNSPVITDSLGIARAVFRDIGLPSVNEYGDPVPSIITAKFNPLGLEAVVEIAILERNPVSSITLRSAAEQMIAGGGDSTSVRATCFLENGSFAPVGTLVIFETDRGRFTEDAVPVTGNYGVSETCYIAGNQVGAAILKASVQNDGAVIYSNEVMIDLLPGPPSRITVSASPNQLITNDPESFSTVTAIVTDIIDNPLTQGILVRFESSLGNITPSAVTDESGHAVVRLTAGVEAGMAEVTAKVQAGADEIVGGTTVTFISGSPNSIELKADPLNIAVAGTGGISTSTLTAEVRDANGNLVEAHNSVIFELLNEPPAPQGCVINNHGAVDSALTSNGRAVVSLNAGRQIGGKLIRAYTWRDETRRDTVQVILATIAVISGPPHQLDIDLNDDGDDAFGGAWAVQVSARVYDIHRNPVANNIPVVFTVEPGIASISAGYTGNAGRGGFAEPGLAYSSMVYHSENTLSPIIITAEVASQQGMISGSKNHLLPLQDGELELHCDPQNWMFDRARATDPCLVRLWVVLKDGHQITINNAPVLFTTSRGLLFWLDWADNELIPFFPNPVRKLTGVQNGHHNEDRGHATVFLRGVMRDFFLDDFAVTSDVQINAVVEGYPDALADPIFVYMTRH